MARLTSLTFALAMLVSVPAALRAQCSWCVSVTDVCCDASASATNHTLTCATTKIYSQWEGSGDNDVDVAIYDITGGGEVLIASSTLKCGCDKALVYDGASLPSGTVLRLKAACDGCPHHDCANQNVTVRFYTPSSNVCAPNCSGS